MLKSPGWESSAKIRHDTEKVTSVFTNRTSKPKPAPLQCPAIKERNPVIQRARTHPHMPSPFGQVLCLDSSMEMYCECMPMQPLLQSVSFLLPLTLWPQQSNALLSPSSDFSWHHLFWNLRGLKSVFKPSLFVNDQGLFWCVTFQRHLDWAPSIQECPTSHPGQKHWHSSELLARSTTGLLRWLLMWSCPWRKTTKPVLLLVGCQAMSEELHCFCNSEASFSGCRSVSRP